MDAGGQFLDRGHSYSTAIFVHSEQQRLQAEASKQALQASRRFKGPIVTPILPAGPFYAAEAEHQGYHKSSPDIGIYLIRFNKKNNHSQLYSNMVAWEHIYFDGKYGHI
ncbi:hypothetical protein B9T62_38505 [Paenibacillus donghaensis]|uniref:peptide-methionine (S)-S-oxide reductase n=1 Tax=Paenibacillus donghaensis TaxID=414771 RepID=A0A2Z2KX07_9BACL|nr:hypothetical protein B9T62_38505 [Paenibacillus donghaensis]